MNLTSKISLAEALARRHTNIVCEEQEMPNTKRALELTTATIIMLAREYGEEIAAGAEGYEGLLPKFAKMIPHGLPDDVIQFVMLQIEAALSGQTQHTNDAQMAA